jgi:hypothetical protein
MFGIYVHRAVPARPGGTSCRADPARRRASSGRRASRAVPARASCRLVGPRHGPRAVLSCRAARWARSYSPGRVGPWPVRRERPQIFWNFHKCSSFSVKQKYRTQVFIILRSQSQVIFTITNVHHSQITVHRNRSTELKNKHTIEDN